MMRLHIFTLLSIINLVQCFKIDKLNASANTYVIQDNTGFAVTESVDTGFNVTTYTDLLPNALHCLYCCNTVVDGDRNLLYAIPSTTDCPIAVVDLDTQTVVSNFTIPGKGSGPNNIGTAEDFVEAATLSDDGLHLYLKVFHFKPGGGPCEFVILHAGRRLSKDKIWNLNYYSRQAHLEQTMLVANQTQVLVVTTTEIGIIGASGDFLGTLSNPSHYLPLSVAGSLYAQHGPGAWDTTAVQRFDITEDTTMTLVISTVFLKPPGWTSVTGLYRSEDGLVISGISSEKFVISLAYIDHETPDVIDYFYMPRYPNSELDDVVFESFDRQIGVYSDGTIVTCPCDLTDLTPIPQSTPIPTSKIVPVPTSNRWYRYQRETENIVQPLFLISYLLPVFGCYLLIFLYHFVKLRGAVTDFKSIQATRRTYAGQNPVSTFLPKTFRYNVKSNSYVYETLGGFKRLFITLLFFILVVCGVVFHALVTRDWEVGFLTMIYGGYGLLLLTIFSFWTYSKVIFDDTYRMIYVYTAKPVWRRPVFGSWHICHVVPTSYYSYGSIDGVKLQTWGEDGKQPNEIISSSYIPDRYTFSIEINQNSGDGGSDERTSLRMGFGLDFTLKWWRSEQQLFEEFEKFVSERQAYNLQQGEGYQPPMPSFPLSPIQLCE
eukprot:TRINITY_DN19481_c0_g1_i1.p1 TRINITY_DN19481_c0_g1~~TRINITY_DN19481_c0_g1_i1.p1  ORF type:complete len:658 (+),score=56.05 TRINITY_DN19481_c0_g1_i1:212-2185(+)